MRLHRRYITPHLNRQTLALLAGVFIMTLTACNLPDINIVNRKHAALARAENSLASSPDSPDKDKKYLATVQVRFSESKDVAPLRFDIRRDKRKFITAKLFETEKTSTTFNLGYTRSDGPIIGCRFSWRF